MTSSPALPRLKRPKVAIACDMCRRRKIKCDGSEPECGPCRSRGDPDLHCSWNDSRSRVDIRKLQRRIDELQHKSPSSAGAANPLLQQPSPPSSAHRPSRWSQSSERDSPASAMIGPVDVDPVGSSYGFFGDSSAGRFVAQIREAVGHSISSSSAPRLRRECGQWRQLSLDECALPPRSRADALMSVYWDAVHPLYPFVDRVIINEQYESLFMIQAFGEINSFLLCALNLIFALSCQLNTTVAAHHRQHSAQVFFERAQKSLDLWKLPSSLESVQVLLLLAQYLQSTNEPLQCWNFVGSAVRMAENLGLHLRETSEHAACIRDREMMRRVWHGCVLMDRVSAMAYGRPTMINQTVAARTPLPVAIDEEDLTNEVDQEHPSRLAFFVQSLKLYDILEEILRVFYANKEKRRDNCSPGFLDSLQSRVASTVDVDSKLMMWEVSLPDRLQYKPDLPAQAPTVFFRQAVVLRQRYYGDTSPPFDL
ncbi:hypothetical protein FE257_009081 [Aspergillus nanangensis]|uniref:Zn(2)-C6 fungal-type domain-containing protein n=1 Tax=Aspergillus nanangensis TaxID=2582783 RepID=A0AAD4CYG2_ASPNN|nr:hypothetical protein FE257_009081 [Aspergillus nanangensis]